MCMMDNDICDKKDDDDNGDDDDDDDDDDDCEYIEASELGRSALEMSLCSRSPFFRVICHGLCIRGASIYYSHIPRLRGQRKYIC